MPTDEINRLAEMAAIACERADLRVPAGLVRTVIAEAIMEDLAKRGRLVSPDPVVSAEIAMVPVDVANRDDDPVHAYLEEAGTLLQRARAIRENYQCTQMPESDVLMSGLLLDEAHLCVVLATAMQAVAR